MADRLTARERRELPVAPYEEQKAQGLKPRGICPQCWREVALLKDNAVRTHNRPAYGYKARRDLGRKTSSEICKGSGSTTLNLTPGEKAMSNEDLTDYKPGDAPLPVGTVVEYRERASSQSSEQVSRYEFRVKPEGSGEGSENR